MPDNEYLRRHEALFKAYFKPLVVYGTRLIKDQPTAEDIVQEIFAKVWKKRSEIEFGDKMVSYLFGAVKNACLNNARHLKVVRKYEFEFDYQKTIIENPHHYLMLQEIEQKIDATLDAMPDKTRDIFVMSRYEQKKNKEIADVLNISIKTVEAHMTKVLAALRRNLQQYIGMILLMMLTAWQ